MRAPVAADCVGGLRDDVVRDLGLGSHGFRPIEPEVAAFALAADGPGLTLRDPVRTAIELRTGTKPRDAEAFVAFDRRIRRWAPSWPASRRPSRRPRVSVPRGHDRRPTLLNGLRHLGRQQLREALRVLPMSVADLVDEAVEGEALRGVPRRARRSLRGHGPTVGGDGAQLHVGLGLRGRSGGPHGRARRAGLPGEGARRRCAEQRSDDSLRRRRRGHPNRARLCRKGRSRERRGDRRADRRRTPIPSRPFCASSTRPRSARLWAGGSSTSARPAWWRR